MKDKGVTMKKKLVINILTIIAILTLVFGQFILVFVEEMFNIPVNEQFHFVVQVILFVYTALLMIYIVFFFSIEEKNSKLICTRRRTKKNIFFIIGTEMFIVMMAFLLYILNYHVESSSALLPSTLVGVLAIAYVVVMVGSLGLGISHRSEDI